MEYGKFIVSGEDKKTLSCIKNALLYNGHIFLGYLKEPNNILRHIRNSSPDLLIVEANNNFRDLKQTIEVVDEDLLAACILILNNRNDEIFDFLKNTRVTTYIAKPVFDEAIMQIADISLINFRRIQDYEQKVRKLNDTLESRKIVEKAKWILVEQEGLTEADAYDVIRKKSRDNRMHMRDIAEAILLTRG